MSLITCGDCKEKVSSSAMACPKCGFQVYPLKTAAFVIVSLFLSISMYNQYVEWDYQDRVAHRALEECLDGYDSTDYENRFSQCDEEKGESYAAGKNAELYGFFSIIFVSILLVSLIYLAKKFKTIIDSNKMG